MRCAALAMTVAALLSLCPSSVLARDAPASVFDRPLQTRRIALGRNRELRCFTFAHVMVKEIDKAEVGDAAAQLAHGLHRLVEIDGGKSGETIGVLGDPAGDLIV